MSSRLKFEKPLNYSSKVLIGRWQDERDNALSPFFEHKFEKASTYQEHFNAQPLNVDCSVRWDQKLNSELSDFIPENVSHDTSANYFNNFSSTYDLSFHHFPKCYDRWIPREKKTFRSRERPREADYISSFGNLTNFGLYEYKKEQWECQSPDIHQNISSHYEDTYVRPSASDYKFQRFVIPLPNSSKTSSVNYITAALKLRNRSDNVYEPFPLAKVKKPSTFNPITWEQIPEVVQ